MREGSGIPWRAHEGKREKRRVSVPFRCPQGTRVGREGQFVLGRGGRRTCLGVEPVIHAGELPVIKQDHSNTLQDNLTRSIHQWRDDKDASPHTTPASSRGLGACLKHALRHLASKDIAREIKKKVGTRYWGGEIILTSSIPSSTGRALFLNSTAVTEVRWSSFPCK